MPIGFFARGCHWHPEMSAQFGKEWCSRATDITERALHDLENVPHMFHCECDDKEASGQLIKKAFI